VLLRVIQVVVRSDEFVIVSEDFGGSSSPVDRAVNGSGAAESISASPANQIMSRTGRLSVSQARAPPTREYEYTPRENGSFIQSWWKMATSSRLTAAGFIESIVARDKTARRSTSLRGKRESSVAGGPPTQATMTGESIGYDVHHTGKGSRARA
jgi:hypothetical protein